MKITPIAGNDEVAMVYIAEFGDKKEVEFVESIQPPLSREEKWILTISTLFNCPIGCSMCDAGGRYQGILSKEELMAQIDYLVQKRYPQKLIPALKFKIQFARMGEPALNPHVLEVLRGLPFAYDAPGLIPSLSTIAPHGCDSFLDEILEIKNEFYGGGHFQLQFSIHTTDQELRNKIIPVRKWDFAKIGVYGERFYKDGDRKITLNFALAETSPLSSDVLSRYFSPELFLLKITPLNPTYKAQSNGLSSYLDHRKPLHRYDSMIQELSDAGFEVVLSLGDSEENRIGSNCGQYIKSHMNASSPLSRGYEASTY